MSSDPPATTLALGEVASLLRLPTPAVEALVGSGYLVAIVDGPMGPVVPLSDVKAFLARNADNGSGASVWLGPAPPVPGIGVERIDPEHLLSALDGRSGDMAHRVYDIFSTVYPEAVAWKLSERAEFIEQAKARFEAILAVAGQGAEVDEALVDDLQAVGANAARAGAPLPQLLVILRISRDLVVQTAVELAGEQHHAGLALSLLLTRVLPAMDGLTDALAQGYWATVIGREDETLARYEHFAAHSTNGVYEVDLDGRITFANQSLALVLGRRRRDLEGAELGAVLHTLDPHDTLDLLLSDHGEGGHHQHLTVRRADGVRRVLSVYSTARRVDGDVVGYQGIVHDETAEREFDNDRRELTALLSGELRGPLAAIVGLGATLESHGEELATDQMQRIGQSIRLHAERISRLADDLYAMAQLNLGTLRLTPRPVELAGLVKSALASVRRGIPVAVNIEEGVTVLVDPRRLEQVVGNLVDNALAHGAPPVEISAEQQGDEVLVAVVDHGAGVAPDAVDTLFAGLPSRRGHGGLSLVRGLAEAMGGRVWYEPGERECRFYLVLPAPARGV